MHRVVTFLPCRKFALETGFIFAIELFSESKQSYTRVHYSSCYNYQNLAILLIPTTYLIFCLCCDRPCSVISKILVNLVALAYFCKKLHIECDLLTTTLLRQVTRTRNQLVVVHFVCYFRKQDRAPVCLRHDPHTPCGFKIRFLLD